MKNHKNKNKLNNIDNNFNKVNCMIICRQHKRMMMKKMIKNERKKTTSNNITTTTSTMICARFIKEK